MADQTYIDIYQEMVNLLQETQLGWVVDQLEEQFRLGKPQIIEVKTSKESRHSKQPNLFDGEQIQNGPPARYVTTIEYTIEERLQLLIEAIINLLNNVPEMYSKILVYFEDHAHVNQIRFDEGRNSNEIIIINHQISTSNNDDLKLLLTELLKEVRKIDH